MESGKVKWFSPKMKYGFIVKENGDELFFHRNGCQWIIPGETVPEFSGSSFKFYPDDCKSYRIEDPEKDELVVFWRVHSYKGDKASPWGYKAQFNEAMLLMGLKASKEIAREAIKEAEDEIWRQTGDMLRTAAAIATDKIAKEKK
jgi:hypothetical protein